MAIEQQDNENLINAWRRFKRMIKRCPHHNIPRCILMEQLYFGLSKDTQQSIDVVLIGGILRPFYH